MGKTGDINFLKNFGPAAVKHAMEKPFSDEGCWRYLLEIGTLMSLLPPPPGRLLDLGCGTGWTSRFFAKRGYEVVGVDIARDMITGAEEMKRREPVDNLTFLVADYEDLNFKDEFDAAVFYDSLHHAVDEQLAIEKAHQALRHGGVFLCSEPGQGHTRSAHTIEMVERFDVTEKDMAPYHIMDVGRQLGFREFACYPFAWLNRVYTPDDPALIADFATEPNPLRRLMNSLGRRLLGITGPELRTLLIYARHLGALTATPHSGGITRMVK